jgi:inner membrane protein
MDSLSQVALGAAVGVAVMGRRVPVWQSALWGGICGTLPDLDAFVDHGDPVRNMTFHRAESHALLYLTLAAPLIALLPARLHRHAAAGFGRWWLAVWLALVTHPLLDAMTIYGTQLLLPFTDHPFGLGSIFIIDPLYTLPLLLGVVAALALRSPRGFQWNKVGLVLSTAYLAWSVVAQWHVQGIVRDSLAAQGIAAERVFVGPAAFSTVLWRVVAMTPDGYHEAFYSLLDDAPRVRFDAFSRDRALYEKLKDQWPVARMAWFSHGFFKMHERDGVAVITDLRMGQEPGYVFAFAVAQRTSPQFRPITPVAVGGRIVVGRALAWYWPRLLGARLPPPR